MARKPVQTAHKEQGEWEQPKLPHPWPITEQADGERPPVVCQEGGQYVIGRFGLFEPEDLEPVRIERVLGEVGGVVIIRGVVNRQRLASVEHCISKSQDEKGR